MEATSLDDSSIAKVSIMKTKKKSLFAWFGRTVAVGMVPLMMFGCASDGKDGKDAVADNSTSTGSTVVNNNPPSFSTDPSAGNVITGTSVLKISFNEAVTGVTNGTNVVLKNGSGIVANMDHTTPTSGNTYTFDPNPDLTSGTYYLTVGAGTDIVDSDKQAATPSTVIFTVDDARTTAKAAMNAASITASVVTAAVAAADNVTNNLMSVIPAAMGAGIAAATDNAAKQSVISSLIGSANGAASLTSTADRTITRINDSTGFTTLLQLIGDTLTAQAVAGKLSDAEFQSAITTVNTALTAAGADSDQLSGLQSGFNSAIDDDVSTAVSAGTLTAAYTNAVTVATGSTAGTGTSGSSFNLSTNIDAGSNFTGTANNDTYYASDTTLTAGDSLDGGAGTDAVILSWALAGTESVSAFTFANIETLTTSVADADTSAGHVATMSLASVTSLTTLNVDGSTEANANDDTLTITNIPSGVTLGINSTNLNVNATYVTAATTGTGNTVALTFNGAASAASNDSNIDVATGFESATLTTSGSASTIGDLDFNGATSITVSGDQNLTIRGGLEDAVVTVNASSMTGALSIFSGNAAEASSGTTDFTFIGGAGNDVADLTGMDANDEISFAGGAGNDRVVTVDEINETGDSLDGGEGTADVVAVGADLDADFSDVVSNFEILELTTAPLTYATLSEFSGTQFIVSAEDASGGGDGAALLSMDAMRSGATVTLNPTGGTGNVTQETGSGDDGIEVNISLGTDATSGDSITIDAKAGYEEISDDTQDDFETVTFKYTGTSAGTVDLLDFGNASAVTLEATGAALTLTSAVFKADADITATTSTQNITATFNTNGLNSYAGGTGNDAITLGVAGDLKQGNTFSDAGGTDSLTGTATSAQDLGLVAATGYETITLISNATAGDTVTADLRNVTGLTTFAVTGGDNGDSFTIQRLSPDTTFTLTDTITNATLTLQSGTTHKVGASSTGRVDGTLTLDAGATTLEINTSSASVQLDAIAGGSLATVTASGSNALIISAMPANAVTVNASSMTAALTYIGGTAADNVTGSSIADTIQNTASGANATAADVLTGGAGFDTFTFIGSAASSTSYASVPNVTDFTVSATAGQTDLIRLSTANTDYAAGLSVDGTAAGASGTVGVLDIAQNSGATDSGSSTTNEFFKLTTSVGFSTNHQGTFNAAIGTSTVTNLTAGTYAVSYHDSTNNKMVILEVATNDTTLGTGDVVRVIGTIDMTAADYANIDADNFANFL